MANLHDGDLTCTFGKSNPSTGTKVEGHITLGRTYSSNLQNLETASETGCLSCCPQEMNRMKKTIMIYKDDDLMSHVGEAPQWDAVWEGPPQSPERCNSRATRRRRNRPPDLKVKGLTSGDHQPLKTKNDTD